MRQATDEVLECVFLLACVLLCMTSMTGDDARQATDDASGRDYYYNAQTGLTQWEVIVVIV